MLLPDCLPDWSTVAFTLPVGWQFHAYESNLRRVQVECPECVKRRSKKEPTTP
jgi:hypothetical protein